jgi:membrane protein DedA with SNARE-associated domain
MLKRLAVTLLLLAAAGALATGGAPGAVGPGGVEAVGPEKTPAPRVERLEQDFMKAVARVQPLLTHYGYAAVFLTVMVEGVGIPAPGQTLLIAAALTAAQGHLSIVWVLIFATAAAVLGNSLGYLLGRWGGRPLLARFRVRGDRLERLEERFRRYGGSLVVVARFFDGLRQLNGIVAGMLNMPWRAFTGYNVLGAGLWAGSWGLGAYWLDKEIGTIHHIFHRIQPWAAALTLVGCLGLLVYLFHRRQKKKLN